MSNFESLMQKMVNSDYNTLVGLAREARDRLMPVCKEVDPENNGLYMFCSIVLSAIGADGKLSILEQKMLADVLGLKSELVDKFIGMYDSRMVALTDKFADSLGADNKAHAIMLVTAFAAVDETIVAEETAFIHKLFE